MYRMTSNYIVTHDSFSCCHIWGSHLFILWHVKVYQVPQLRPDACPRALHQKLWQPDDGRNCDSETDTRQPFRKKKKSIKGTDGGGNTNTWRLASAWYKAQHTAASCVFLFLFFVKCTQLHTRVNFSLFFLFFVGENKETLPHPAANRSNKFTLPQHKF